MSPFKNSPSLLIAITVVGLIIVGNIDGQESPVPKVSEPLQSPIEVQTRGPLHEAFAQPLEEKPLPGEIVPKEPPPVIQELPPEARPDIDNAEWIPGYWAWDADRGEFLWISGVYRVAPRGRTFVPGYWSQTDNGWRWIPGFWSNTQQSEIPYAPEPPAPLSVGPTPPPPPDENSTYIPGVWAYNTNRFTWRPGYWAAVQVGRVWTPPRYIWTPNGYLFIDGFWDEPYDSRGMIFAPVAFNRPLWRDPNWRYRPDHVVSLSLFFDSAFVRGGAFFFGNFYGQNYAQRGYRPWFNGASRYDPAFAYFGWQNNRTNPNWIGNVQATYANRSAGRASVPPATLAQQQAAKTPAVVTPLNQVASSSVKLVRPTTAQTEAQKTNAQRIRDLGVNRQLSDAAVLKQPKTNRETPTGEGRVFRVPTTTPPVMSQTLTFPTTPKGPGSEAKLVAPTPKNVTTPKTSPPPAPKVITSPPPAPKVITSPPPAPKVITSPPPAPKVIASPPPAPKVISSPPPAPKVISLPPRVSPPPSAPRVAPPPPRPAPPPPTVSPPPRPAPPPTVSPPPRPAPPPAPRPKAK